MSLTAEITVLEPCECEVCRDDRAPWWKCRKVSARFIAAYDAPSDDGPDGAIPSNAAIAYVRAAHPGAVLVYIRGV